MQSARKTPLYDHLRALPDTLTGEILNGQLHTQPRPSGPHAIAGSSLGGELVGTFQKGRGGPGGWWIIDEPEVHFVRDIEVVVPDLAGWKRDRLPVIPQGHRFEVVPDWVCEIQSPATASKDREVKMPIYAHYGVAFAWLLDPKAHTLEAFRLQDGSWTEVGNFAGGGQVSVAPFDAISFDLAELWV